MERVLRSISPQTCGIVGIDQNHHLRWIRFVEPLLEPIKVRLERIWITDALDEACRGASHLHGHGVIEVIRFEHHDAIVLIAECQQTVYECLICSGGDDHIVLRHKESWTIDRVYQGAPLRDRSRRQASV